MLSLVKLAGTDQRYYLKQAQRRIDRVGSMASGAEDYFLCRRRVKTDPPPPVEF